MHENKSHLKVGLLNFFNLGSCLKSVYVTQECSLNVTCYAKAENLLKHNTTHSHNTLHLLRVLLKSFHEPNGVPVNGHVVFFAL